MLNVLKLITDGFKFLLGYSQQKSQLNQLMWRAKNLTRRVKRVQIGEFCSPYKYE